MASIEEIEIDRYAQVIEEDVRHLVKKYGRIMGWDVPDLDEQAAHRLILDTLQKTVARIAAET